MGTSMYESSCRPFFITFKPRQGCEIHDKLLKVIIEKHKAKKNGLEMQTSDANQLLKENDLGICDDNTHINYQSMVGG
jgi:hypothetical protein